MLRSQYWSRDEFARWQTEQLEARLKWAREEVPFYTSAQWAAGLEAFPVINRETLRKAYAELRPRGGSPSGTLITSSGGSSGQPVPACYDPETAALRLALAWRGDAWGTRLSPDARQAALWGYQPDLGSRTPLLERLAHYYRNIFLLDSLYMDAARARQLNRHLWRLRPRIVYGYVSALTAYVHFCQEQNLQSPAIVKLIPTAEHCSPSDRELLAGHFNCPVRERYGSRELGPMAHQCEYGHWHLHSESVVYEVLRPDGSIGSSGSGSLLCTSLTNRSLALIRYEIGDVLDLTPVDCACGRCLPTFTAIEGRSSEHLYRRDGVWVNNNAVEKLFRFVGARRYRLTQDAPDHVRIQLQHHNGNGEELVAAASRAAQELFADQLSVDVELVDQIAPLPSGKNPYVVNLLPRRVG